MRKIEIELTDKEYAMLLADTIIETGDEADIGKIVTEAVIRRYRDSGYQPWSEQIEGYNERIQRIQKAIEVLKEVGLEKFAHELGCHDDECEGR